MITSADNTKDFKVGHTIELPLVDDIDSYDFDGEILKRI